MRYLNKAGDLEDRPLTSDTVHNHNCYRFLRRIKLPNPMLKEIPEMQAIHALQNATYHADFPYGALYSSFMGNLEDMLSRQKDLLNSDFDDLFISLYENENHNLEETYKLIQTTVLNKTPSSTSVQKELERAMRDQKNILNPYTPSQSGSAMGRLWDMIAPHFKPSHKTSLSTKRTYQYNQNSPQQELRFGTQGQTQYYKSRVSPLFERFLAAKMRYGSKQERQEITHIYFNNLGKDRSQWSYEGRFEAGLTSSLHELEKRHSNIAVITFPADKGLMDHHAFFDLHPEEKIESTKQKFLDIAMESSASKVSTKDFHISPHVRELLFDSQQEEKAILNELLDKSFKRLGLNVELLSPAQSQAVWIHFIKYELPNFILEKLNPQTFNFSCKDAIDRGGISSAYYNLIQSFSTPYPLSRDEFETALHAAPVMVKGRGINNHINIIWNVVDQYMQANPEELHDPKKQWLIAWRDANCPKERAQELLERRLPECIATLEAMEKTPDITKGLEALRSIQENTNQQDNDALFLDATISTYHLCLNSTEIQNPQIEKHYEELCKRMDELNAPPASFMQKLLKFLMSFLSLKSRESLGSPKIYKKIYKDILPEADVETQDPHSRTNIIKK